MLEPTLAHALDAEHGLDGGPERPHAQDFIAGREREDNAHEAVVGGPVEDLVGARLEALGGGGRTRS